MAAITTDQMLRDIQGGTAAELVMAVRYDTDPPGPTFIHSLDQEILATRPHAGRSSLQRGDLVEIIGPSGSGKTSFMMFMLLTALLPPSLDLPATNNNPPMSVALGGRNSSAAYVLPVTHSLPIDNLRESLRSHARVCVDGALLDAGLSRRMLPEHLQAIEETVLASLQRLRIIRVRPRYLSWALALRRLLLPRSRRRADAACVMDEDSHDDDDNGLSLVLCDGLADGFWPERWAEEERREQKKPSISVVRGADDVGMRDVMEAIGRLRKELGSIVVVSLQGIFHERHGGTSAPSQFFSPSLPRPFPAPFAPQAEDVVPIVGTGGKDPTYWPLNMELTMLGPPPRMKFPAEIVLVDALRSNDAQRARSADLELQAMMGKLRMPEGRGAAGTWDFSVGTNGIEVFVE